MLAVPDAPHHVREHGSRQTWCWSSSGELPCESVTTRQRESKLGMSGALEISKPAPMTPLPPTRPRLKPFPNRSPPTGDQTYELMGAVLIKELHGTHSSTPIHTVRLVFSLLRQAFLCVSLAVLEFTL